MKPKLNFFEAVAALKDGKKIRGTKWDEGRFVGKDNDEVLRNEHDEAMPYIMFNCEYEIVEG